MLINFPREKKRSKSIPTDWVPPHSRGKKPFNPIRKKSPISKFDYFKINGPNDKGSLMKKVEIQQFTSTINSVNQIIRELFLPIELMENFLQSTEKINKEGIKVLKSGKNKKKNNSKQNQNNENNDVDEFMNLWNDLFENFSKYTALGPNERMHNFFDSSIAAIKTKFDPINNIQQCNKILGELENEVNAIHNSLKEFEKGNIRNIQNRINQFIKDINDTKLFTLAKISMQKREIIQQDIKRIAERIIKCLDSYISKDQLVVKAQEKMNFCSMTINNLFYPPDNTNNISHHDEPSEQPIPKSNTQTNDNMNSPQEQQEKQPELRLKNARKDNRIFKQKLEDALKEEEKMTIELQNRENELETSRKELKALKPTKAESCAVSKRNESRKLKKELTESVESLRSEIQTLEEKLNKNKDEHEKFISIRKDLEEVEKENELNKSIKKYSLRYLSKMNKNTDIKKLQDNYNKLCTEYNQLMSKRNDPSIMYYDTQRFQHENSRLQSELQYLKLRNISISKETDFDEKIASLIQSSKKELKEIINKNSENQSKPNDLSKTVNIVPRSTFDPTQKFLDQRNCLQKEYYNLQKGPPEQTLSRRKDIKLELSKIPPIENQYNQLSEELDVLLLTRNEAKASLDILKSTISRYNEMLFRKNMSDANLAEKQYRLEQLNLSFELNEEKMNKLRSIVSERIEMTEKLRLIDEKFMQVFGDRIPPKTTMTLPEKIDFVAKQFNKIK